jgi:hypothetical protein
MELQLGYHVVESTMSFRLADGPAEGRLGFVTLALGDFEFLSQFGFAVARKEPTLVRFENGKVYVNVYHGRSSHMIGVEIGRIHHREVYSLYEVLAALSPDDVGLARLQASDATELERSISRVASVVREKGGGLLRGEADAFSDIHLIVEPIRREATVQAQYGATLRKADQAWETKDWSAALGLYETAVPGLSSTQRKRLEYLRKKRK